MKINEISIYINFHWPLIVLLENNLQLTLKTILLGVKKEGKEYSLRFLKDYNTLRVQ